MWGPCIPSPIWLLKQFLVKTAKKSKQPKLAELITAIKDHVRGQYLYNAINEQKYACIYYYYHTRLLFLMRRLNKNELAALFTTNISFFWEWLDKYAQQQIRKRFDNVYDAVEYFFLANISKLAQY